MRIARAFTYDTADITYFNSYGDAIQRSIQWVDLVCLLYLLNIVEVHY